MNLVVRSGGGAASLLVDEIGDVLEVEKTAFEPPPPPEATDPVHEAGAMAAGND